MSRNCLKKLRCQDSAYGGRMASMEAPISLINTTTRAQSVEIVRYEASTTQEHKNEQDCRGSMDMATGEMTLICDSALASLASSDKSSPHLIPADLSSPAHQNLLDQPPNPLPDKRHDDSNNSLISIVPPKTRKQVSRRFYAEAQALVASKKYQKAEAKINQAIVLNGTCCEKKSIQYRALRARCRLQLREFWEALDDACFGLEIQESWEEGLRLSCKSHMGLGNWAKATALCERVLSLVPKDVEFQHLQGIIHQQLTTESPSTTVFEDDEVASAENTELRDEREFDTKGNADSLGIKLHQDAVELASKGSNTAQRFLNAQELVDQAAQHLQSGELRASFGSLREALRLWPMVSIPASVQDDLLMIGSHDAIAWGGPLLLFHLQATKTGFATMSAERDFWTKRANRYPLEPYLQAKLADVLFRSGDVTGSLECIQKALACGQHEVSWLYFRARCLPTETGSPNGWLLSLRDPRPQQLRREDEFLRFIALSSIDDEWMPHAYYSLGMVQVLKKDYANAEQCRCLAEIAESRRQQLGLFAAIDPLEFVDKKLLHDACANGSVRFGATPIAAESGFRCGWCDSPVLSADAFARHKTLECVSRPSCPNA